MPSPPPIPTESHAFIVRMGEKEDQEKVKGSTNNEILQRFSHPGVIAVKKLESGDVRVFAATRGAKDTLTQDHTWAQRDFPSAIPATPQFQVLVHSIRVEGFNPKEVGTNIRIQEENGRLHPRLKVAQTSWLKSRRAMEGKTHGSAILSVQSQAQANEIVLRGLVYQGTILTAEAFHPHQRPTQCLKCGQFGHITKFCRAEQACGRCSGKHRTDECSEGVRKCSNCQKAHPAWSLSCVVKQAAIARARTFRAKNIGWGTYQPSQPIQGVDEDGFTTVGNKRKATEQPSQGPQPRKLPGKPQGSNAAIIAGRSQSNKIFNAFNLLGSSQDDTQSSQNTMMDDIQTSQNE